jgi:molybdopterin converting factor small subunit
LILRKLNLSLNAMARVLLFGELKDICGLNEFTSGAQSLEELKTKMNSDWPDLKTKTMAFAVNRIIESNNVSLGDNDEVAVMPPFSGG